METNNKIAQQNIVIFKKLAAASATWCAIWSTNIEAIRILTLNLAERVPKNHSFFLHVLIKKNCYKPKQIKISWVLQSTGQKKVNSHPAAQKLPSFCHSTNQRSGSSPDSKKNWGITDWMWLFWTRTLCRCLLFLLVC